MTEAAKHVLFTMKRFVVILLVVSSGCISKAKKSQQEIFESKARSLYQQNKYALAIVYFDTLISINPSSGEYYYSRAFSHSKLSRIRRARDDYKKAIELNHRVPDAYNNLAIDAMLNHEDSLALIFFGKLLKNSPKKIAEIEPLIKICREQIEFQKTDAWKDFREYMKREKRPLEIDTTY